MAVWNPWHGCTKSALAATTAMYTGVSQSLVKIPLGKECHLPQYSAY